MAAEVAAQRFGAGIASDGSIDFEIGGCFGDPDEGSCQYASLMTAGVAMAEYLVEGEFMGWDLDATCDSVACAYEFKNI